MPCKQKLIVALDLPERHRIVDLATLLAPKVAMAKIGLEAFIAHGPDLVREVADLGLDVFLDLKVHDIPRTAAAAARQAGELGARLLTVHASGGIEMIRAARDAAPPDTAIVAVTVLTSFDELGLSAVGYQGNIEAAALRLGHLSREAGADGLVCSAHELEVLTPAGGVRVVPGVRPAGAAAGDQKRVATPRQAVDAGATWLVVGRPIVHADDPLAVVEAIDRELAAESAGEFA